MAEFGFPILTVEECVSFFREVSNSAISEEDLKKPEAKRWQIFFGTVFELMTGRQADLTAQSLQTHLHTLTDCEHTELHEESFALMSFTMALQQVMSAAGIMDFTVRDLIEPRPKRLLRIISGAINFIRFRGCRDEVFNKKKEDLERKRESYDFVLKENAELKKTLQGKQKAHESHMLKMTQLQKENDAISLRIQDQHKQREVLQRSLSEMKNELAQRNAGIDQIKTNILSAQAEGEKLSQRIVQSPERVKAEQERAKNRIMELKAMAEDKHKRLGEVQHQKEVIVEQQQNADKAVRMLRDISNNSDRLGELEKEIQKIQDGRQDVYSTLMGLTSRGDSLRQLQASRHDRLAKLDLQYHNKKAALQEQLSQLAHLKDTLHDPRGSSESKKLELKERKERVVEEVEKKVKEQEAQLEHIKDLYSKILQEVDKKNIEVANGIQNFRTVLKKCQDAH